MKDRVELAALDGVGKKVVEVDILETRDGHVKNVKMSHDEIYFLPGLL